MANSPEPRARRGRPPRYTREHVAKVALATLEHETTKPLTLKRVADELGITPMAIYGYVDDLDDLLQEAARVALDEIRSNSHADGPWNEQIGAAVTDIYRIGRRYPNLVNTALGQNLKSPALFRIREQILEQLARGGFGEVEALHALGQLLAYSLGFAACRARYEPLPPLPTDAFPRLARVADRYDEHVSDAAFQAGLDRLIGSLTREAKGARHRPD